MVTSCDQNIRDNKLNKIKNIYKKPAKLVLFCYYELSFIIILDITGGPNGKAKAESAVELSRWNFME